MIQPIAPETTVGQLVAQRPARARIFERFQIDYCCGGKLSLQEACAKRGVSATAVLDRLRQLEAEADADARGGGAAVDPDTMSLTDLANHIEKTHHAYLRRELPRLDAMTQKVHGVHGESEPRLRALREAFIALKDELSSHMLKEEQILFPIIRELERSPERPAMHCGSIAHPVAQMEREHEQAGDALAVMRQATDGYVPPEWACNTYRAMLDALAELERDMHQHVHKENNVLFPKALALEAGLVRREGA